jgi:hypothetical protein
MEILQVKGGRIILGVLASIELVEDTQGFFISFKNRINIRPIAKLLHIFPLLFFLVPVRLGILDILGHVLF